MLGKIVCIILIVVFAGIFVWQLIRLIQDIKKRKQEKKLKDQNDTDKE